jgi:hypothetical protein
MVTFGDVLYDPKRDQNELGREVLRRLGLEAKPDPYYLDPGPLLCPACGEPIEDDDEETWYLPEGTFWHDPCYLETALPVVGDILEEEYQRRAASGE